MKKKLLLLLVCLITLNKLVSAQGWTIIPNTPVEVYRHDDVSFYSLDSGLIINNPGQIFLTHDGGLAWDTILVDSTFMGRSIGMLSPTTFIAGQFGFVGSTFPLDSNAMYVTFNSGQNWSPVTNYSGPKPVGICGISVVNENVAMGVGRFSGSPIFVKTIDGGLSFISMDMSAYSSGLIDCHFFTPDSGIVVGRSPFSSQTSSVPTVVFTADGGNTWQTVYSGSVTSRWCWKISFPSRQIGYISVENDYGLGTLDTNYVLKSTDGGMSWQILPVYVGGSRFQGIGFINDSIGWVGDNAGWKTVNGGNSWTQTNEINAFNRMRIINDTTFVAVGKYFYKYNTTSFGINENVSSESGITDLIGTPNPLTNKISLSYQLKVSSTIVLYLYNQAGIIMYKTHLPTSGPGKKLYELDMENFSSGIYFLILQSEQGGNSLSIVKQ